ncbi:MAG: Tm-1-like ATP-binding domain-containing protein [Nitrospinota bacterium]
MTGGELGRGFTIVLIGTLDTKWPEYAFVRDRLRRAGAEVRLVDVSLRGAGRPEADVPPEAVAGRAGTSLETLRGLSRQDATRVMIRGAAPLLGEWVGAGEVHGVLALGGANGTTLACGVMRTLPVGFPKVMVSVMASARMSQYVGTSDIVMIPSIGDLSLNRVSRKVLSGAAGAVLGMAGLPAPPDDDPRPLLAMTTFGVTQPCVERAKAGLEAAGFEVMELHASGPGGRALEELARKGMFDGVIDLTTSELADDLAGGRFTAGPGRLEGAGAAGSPQGVVPGALAVVPLRNRFPGRFLRHAFPD